MTVTKFKPALHPNFLPASLYKRWFKEEILKNNPMPFYLQLIRENGNGHFQMYQLAGGEKFFNESLFFILKDIKFLLWSFGGFELQLSGDERYVSAIRENFSKGGKRSFDAEIMERSYQSSLKISVHKDHKSFSKIRDNFITPKENLDGLRIGFDLGASDFKISAIKNGEVIFSDEIPWNPTIQTEISYHEDLINQGLEKAREKLGKVDAIGGSSAGIIVDNKIRVASLLRSIPADKFEFASQLFDRIQKRWNVPLVVLNDGDVTALAGAYSLKSNGILGIALGSSQACGYVNMDGKITGQLNELAFAPVDFSTDGFYDDWAMDYGIGSQYFSQQAVNNLIKKTTLPLKDLGLPLPEQLKEVQKLANNGDPQAIKIFEDIGIFLGYSIPHYLDYYDFKKVLILGRVTSGVASELIIKNANQVLIDEFPKIASQIQIVVPDEKMKRVGQAIAAASLPSL